MNPVIEKIIEANRLLIILSEKIEESPYFDGLLMSKIADYTADYIVENSLDNPSIVNSYFKFIKSYNKDMKRFANTGKYPLEFDSNRKAPERFDYDIILLFSCLFSEHRFRIMQLIEKITGTMHKGLFIGCGPGLEIELVKNNIEELIAYDFSLNDFTIKKHPEVTFKEEYFDGKINHQKFDGIFLIELLEHLKDPYELLSGCIDSLSIGGRIILTTATNIPQFDHLYNFESSHKEFELLLGDLGCKINYVEDIPHQRITIDIKAKNRFYVLEKIK